MSQSHGSAPVAADGAVEGDDRSRRALGRPFLRRFGAMLLLAYGSGWLVLTLLRTGLGASVVNTIYFRGHGQLDDVSIQSAWNIVRDQYVLRDAAADKGTAGAEQGIIDSLRSAYQDRFSAFLSRDEFAALHADLSGKRNGSIGIAIEARCPGGQACSGGAVPTELDVESVLHDQPADRAGLRNGDVLVAVDGRRVDGLPGQFSDRAGRVAPLIRGKPGTAVTLTIARVGTPLTVSVIRADLQVRSVFTTHFGPTLYMQVTGFDTTTGDDATAALTHQLTPGTTSVVLDLRHNGGGYVSAAQKLASQFLQLRSGQQKVVVRRGRMAGSPSGDPSSAQSVEADPILSGGVALTPRLVVIIDGDSASAAEIVAAALHDYKRATLVGVKSFGKGSVQVDFPLPDGNDLHLTVEKWYGPGGESIDLTGITPDRVVSRPRPEARFELDAQSIPAAEDPQLQAALAAAR